VIEIYRRNCGAKFASQWNWNELAEQKSGKGNVNLLVHVIANHADDVNMLGGTYIL
jgi:hypothetical protein